MIGRNQDVDAASNDLLGGVLVKSLGARVPAHDDAVERLADDRVVGRLDDCGQMPRGLRGLFAPRDVPSNL